MRVNVSGFFVNHLSNWGVKRIFGYSGDSIRRLLGLGGLNRAGGKRECIEAVEPLGWCGVANSMKVLDERDDFCQTDFKK